MCGSGIIRIAILAGTVLGVSLVAVPPTPLAADHESRLPLRTVSSLPIATIGLRGPLPDHPGLDAPESFRAASAECDKDIDTTSNIAGVSFVAAQDNLICTNADIDVYEGGGQLYAVQAGGQEAAFTITHIDSAGAPTLIIQTIWVSGTTGNPLQVYTPDVKAFKQGPRSYIALSLERLPEAPPQTTCGVVIADVTDAPTISLVDQITSDEDEWCDVHNSFVEDDANGDGRYLYLTADSPNDMRVLDIGDLSNIIEIGRYTHPEASSTNYVHDVTVIDHGGSIGRRVYVSYWGAGLMILDAADVTPGVVEAGSSNQSLNADHSIDPTGFFVHHAYPNDDGTRVIIQDEFLSSAGQEPVQMWDISSPASPSYVDGIILGSSLMPVENPAHNLLVAGDRLYMGWYKAGLQAFDFDASGFTGRPLYHQVQTEPTDDSHDGAWGVRLGTAGVNTYILQSDRRYGIIVDLLPDAADSDGDGVPDGSDNCPAWPNPGQSLPPWLVPLNDPDCDGFATADETFIGTDPNDACPDIITDVTWPVDFDNSTAVNILDVGELRTVFGSAEGDGTYTARNDLTADGAINILDVGKIRPFFSLSCT